MFNLKFSFGPDVCSMFPHSSERAKRVSIEQQQKQEKKMRTLSTWLECVL